MKDLFHICLEPEAQGHGMTFRVCNLGSKQPHLYSAYVVSVPSQLHTTVFTHNSQDYNEYIMCLLSLFGWWKNNPFLLHDAFIDT